MTRFRYSAYSRKGEQVSGHIDAQNQAHALKIISDLGLQAYLTEEDRSAPEASSNRPFWTRKQMPLAKRASLARELSLLVDAGLPLDNALQIVAEQSPAGLVKSFINQVHNEVTGGRSLSQAMATATPPYPPDETAMILAGEQTGSLAKVLSDIALRLDSRNTLHQQITSAMIYPAVLMVMALAAIIIVATVLVPNLLPVFEDTGADLPLVVYAMIGLNDVLTNYWLLLLACTIAGLGLIILAARSTAFISILDAFKLWSPGVSSFVRQSEISRVSGTLGSLIQSGVPLVEALQVVAGVSRNSVVRSRLQTLTEQVIAGRKFSQCLPDLMLFPPAAQQLVAIGEESNHLGQMLLHVATGAENTLRANIQRLMTLLTPVLTIGIGVFVGGLIMSVMKAILSVNELVF